MRHSSRILNNINLLNDILRLHNILKKLKLTQNEEKEVENNIFFCLKIAWLSAPASSFIYLFYRELR